MKRKEILGVVVFVIVFLLILFVGANRIERIENNEMVLVNQNQMDR
jgi:hypothetical protein